MINDDEPTLQYKKLRLSKSNKSLKEEIKENIDWSP